MRHCLTATLAPTCLATLLAVAAAEAARAPVLLEVDRSLALTHQWAMPDPPPPAERLPEPPAGHTLELLGERVAPGTTRRLAWRSGALFEGLSTSTPVLVVNGAQAGPTVCLTAAVHGDELNGIEMVRRVVHELDAEQLVGAVIGVPVVNLQGFQSGSRYLPDRRDLNRYFPGNPTGSAASRIAHDFFHQVIVHCDALVDLHTGSFHRTNLPQLRADLGDPAVLTLTRGFDTLVVVHSPAARGTLRRAAMDAGIPAVTMEAGEPLRLQPEEVAHGVEGIQGLLASLDMTGGRRLPTGDSAVFYASRWVRADHGGVLIAGVRPGDSVRQGQVLGTITDPVSNRSEEVISPADGRVIGMALNQVVMPGFATFHLGLYGKAIDPDAAPEALFDLARLRRAHESAAAGFARANGTGPADTDSDGREEEAAESDRLPGDDGD